MNEFDDLLLKLKAGDLSLVNYEQIMSLDSNQVEKIMNLSLELKLKNFGNTLKIYIPGKKFPALSVTGNQCALSCDHCKKKYLHGMVEASNSEKLEYLLREHYQNGGTGVLISGGCNSEGAVPLEPFIESIRKLKNSTDLIFNVHTGLLSESTARLLAAARIDVVSFDVNMDKEILKEIYHLKKDENDYFETLQLLKKYELNVVPHICVGLYYGDLHNELKSLKLIKDVYGDLSLIVLIILIPPKKSNKFKTPKILDVIKIVVITRFMFPDSEISLGCMRPRGKLREQIELSCIKSGINRIELPSKKTLSSLKRSNFAVDLQYYPACCAIPTDYEERIRNDSLKEKCK